MITVISLFFSNKDFARKVNKETVDLEDVVEKGDLDWLKDTLEEFAGKTGSPVARQLVDNWPEAASRFVKVCI